jgi:hypothetical protein
MLNDVAPVARRYMHDKFSVTGNWEREKNKELGNTVIANAPDRDPSKEDWLKRYVQDYPHYVSIGCLRGGRYMNLDWDRFPVFAQLIKGSRGPPLERAPRVSIRAYLVKPDGTRWSDKAD